METMQTVAIVRSAPKHVSSSHLYIGRVMCAATSSPCILASRRLSLLYFAASLTPCRCLCGPRALPQVLAEAVNLRAGGTLSVARKPENGGDKVSSPARPPYPAPG